MDGYRDPRDFWARGPHTPRPYGTAGGMVSSGAGMYPVTHDPRLLGYGSPMTQQQMRTLHGQANTQANGVGQQMMSSPSPATAYHGNHGMMHGAHAWSTPQQNAGVYAATAHAANQHGWQIFSAGQPQWQQSTMSTPNGNVYSPGGTAGGYQPIINR